MSEKVNNPSHYGGATNVYEVIKVIRAWGLDKSFALETAERDARKARKTLRSLRASDRALDKKLVNVDPSTTDDATLAETLRARRG